METGLSVLEIITIIAAFQLMMLAVVLITKSSINRLSNRILTGFLVSNSLLLIFFLLSVMNVAKLPVIAVFYYLLAPMIYLYVKSMCINHYRLRPGSALHASVFLVMLVYVIAKALFFEDRLGEDGEYLEYILSQLILHVQIAAYIVASFHTIYTYRKDIKEHYSSVEKINLSWLLLIIGAFTIMWLTDLVSFGIDILVDGSGVVNYYLVVASVTINLLFANYLVYKGMHQPDVFSGLMTPGKYAGSKIPDEESAEVVHQLKDFMQNHKPYLNPDLTIKDLSEHFNIHPKFLSQIINAQIGQNFYDFVNFYRIEEAKKMISQPKDEKMTILEILYEVGFNSKSAFNNAFKKNTGMTPSEFKRTA